MPEICRFYGMIIHMYYGDHIPAHIHVRFQEDEARVAIGSGELLSGTLPIKNIKLLHNWISIHKQELLHNWDLCMHNKPTLKIKPLE